AVGREAAAGARGRDRRAGGARQAAASLRAARAAARRTRGRARQPRDSRGALQDRRRADHRISRRAERAGQCRAAARRRRRAARNRLARVGGGARKDGGAQMKRRRNWPWVLALLLVLGVGGVLVKRSGAGPGNLDSSLIVTVKRGDLPIEVIETGKVQPREKVEIKSKVT